MCVVLGKDPELEDNIELPRLTSLAAWPVKMCKIIPCGEVVADEESEMDEEDDMEETITPLSSFIESTPHSPSFNSVHLYMSIYINRILFIISNYVIT